MLHPKRKKPGAVMVVVNVLIIATSSLIMWHFLGRGGFGGYSQEMLLLVDFFFLVASFVSLFAFCVEKQNLFVGLLKFNRLSCALFAVTYAIIAIIACMATANESREANARKKDSEDHISEGLVGFLALVAVICFVLVGIGIAGTLSTHRCIQANKKLDHASEEVEEEGDGGVDGDINSQRAEESPYLNLTTTTTTKSSTNVIASAV